MDKSELHVQIFVLIIICVAPREKISSGHVILHRSIYESAQSDQGQAYPHMPQTLFLMAGPLRVTHSMKKKYDIIMDITIPSVLVISLVVPLLSLHVVLGSPPSRYS